MSPLAWPRFLRTVIPLVVLQVCLPVSTVAQDVKPAPQSDPPPGAVTISSEGNCDYSRDGITFANLERGQVLPQGAVIRTASNARVDLFLRRMGTTVRLQPGTEMKIEQLAVTMKDGLPMVHTLLDLRTGTIFTVVRSEIAGCTLEIKNAAGRSVVEGSGTGRYIIRADGTHVSAEGSVLPLKVIGENGITIITAGEKFDRKDGKMLSAKSNEWVKDLIQLDQLQAAGEDLVPDNRSTKP